MREEKKKRLEAKGWKIGTVKEFLGLSNEESEYIELKMRLADGLRERRQRHRLNRYLFLRPKVASWACHRGVAADRSFAFTATQPQ